MSLPDYLKDIERIHSWLTWYAEVRDFDNYVALHLLYRAPDSQEITHVGAPVVFQMQPHERHALKAPVPTLQLDRQAATTLMTELWRVGVRPGGIKELPKPAEIAAMQAHLDDMRRLVFSTRRVA